MEPEFKNNAYKNYTTWNTRWLLTSKQDSRSGQVPLPRLTSGGHTSPNMSPTSFLFLLSTETDEAEEISKLKPGNGFYILVS